MKIAYNWLKEYIHLTETPAEVGAMLTAAGLEVETVEEIESIKGGLQGVVLGTVLTCEKHPDADRLRITTVDIGSETPSQIVCGAPNVAAGQKVVVATVGTTLYPNSGEPLKIQKSKIRGQVSEGMICAEDELGLGASHDGIMVLTTDLPNGTPASQYFKLESEFVFEIGLTPNRVDAASHLGVVRDLKALLKRPTCRAVLDNFKPDNNSLPIKVQVENTTGCPRYSALSISGVEVKESPEWLKKRLKSIGLNPINNIVDITNFVLHETGQPLHAFDADTIAGKTIVVKNVAENTPFVTLDGVERKLKATDMMICDTEKPLVLAGVYGGLNSGVSAQTKNIFLESAYFSPETIRKSSQVHGIKTDSSFRFERGSDPENTLYALKRAALLIKEIAGGSISSDITDHYPTPIPQRTIKATFTKINELIGAELDSKLIMEILHNLGFELSPIDTDTFEAKVPSYKTDVYGVADLTEEVLRIYGLNNIGLRKNIGASYLAGKTGARKERIQHTISDMLTAAGYYELFTNSLTKKAYYEQGDTTTLVEIQNKLSEEHGVMRQTLLYSAMEVIQHNVFRKQNELKVYEFGKIYFKNEAKYKEHNRLAIAVTGNNTEESWREKSRKTDYYDLGFVLQNIFAKLGLEKIQGAKTENKLLAYGTDYTLNGKLLASVGEVNRATIKQFDLKQNVYYAEVDFDYLQKAYNEKIQATEIAKFPEVRRDLSLVLDKKVTYKEIREMAMQTEKRLLKEINVFDVFEGEALGEGKKSYSVSFILLDEKQTLTDQAIDQVMNKLMQRYEKELGAIIRK